MVQLPSGFYNTIAQSAERLVACLYAFRRDEAIRRPLIFVAHSVGGILLKRALAHSRMTEHPSIWLATHGIVFLATPHVSFDVESWIASRKSTSNPESTLSANLPLLADLRPGMLRCIDKEFIQFAATDQIHRLYAYEDKPTEIDGKMVYIVEEHSAAPIHFDTEVLSIRNDHTHVCQFESDKAPG